MTDMPAVPNPTLANAAPLALRVMTASLADAIAATQAQAVVLPLPADWGAERGTVTVKAPPPGLAVAHALYAAIPEQDDDDAAAQLSDCYCQALQWADRDALRWVFAPLAIDQGYPVAAAARIAVGEIGAFLEQSTLPLAVTCASEDPAVTASYQTALDDFNALRLRLATAADAPLVAHFNQQMAWETEKRVLADEVALAGILGLLTRPQYGFWWIAEAVRPSGERDVVGTLMVTYEWTNWSNGLIWWVQSVYVRPDWRRRGVFRRLYRRLQAVAARDEPLIRGFRLYAERDNARAIQTYRALGMREPPYRLLEDLRRPSAASN